MKKFSESFGFAVLLVIFIVLFVSIGKTITPTPTASPTPIPSIGPSQAGADLKTFKSWQDVSSFLQSSSSGSRGYYAEGMMVTKALGAVQGAMPAPAAADSSAGSAAPDYSTTNVQVEGVDEADKFKTDGSYIYTISNGQLAILKAYPASEAKLLSVINDSGNSFSEVFVNGDKLVAFGTDNFDWGPIILPMQKDLGQAVQEAVVGGVAGVAKRVVSIIAPDYYPYYRSSTFLKVYDVSDRSNPRLLKTIQFRGSYVTSRMIGSKVYSVFTESAYRDFPRPLYAVDGNLRNIQPTEISYFDYPFDSYQFTTVVGLDLNDVSKEETRKVVLMGYGQNIFVSQQNAYITYTRSTYYYPLWQPYYETLKDRFSQSAKDKLAAVDSSDASDWRKDNLRIQVAQDYLNSISDDSDRSELYQKIYDQEQKIREQQYKSSEQTVIHKFGLGDSISYLGKGEAPGHVLNQFSMDEYNGYFRVATTVGQVWRSNSQTVPSHSNVYVLDSSLKQVGKIEDLAPGETIYSARFMGNRAYLVTFKKIDPLFVIGLDDPTDPILLGKLKIPGYSDYLHPYDETHLIGLGKGAVAAEEGDFAWYQGVKLSLFDVSDVANPKEVAKYEIGDRGTDSYALNDHKAFLFSKARNLLVIPIRLAEINEEKYPKGVTPQTYGDYTFQGAYVFSLDLQNGFSLKGKVSHATPEQLAKSGEYYWGSGTDVERSAYINDVLYTISQKFVKANSLADLTEQASVELPYPQYNDGPYYYGRTVVS